MAQQPIPRLGPQAQSYSRGAIDFSPWFTAGSGVDQVLVSVVDWGGWASVSDVYLHVMGPHAASTVREMRIEPQQPK